MTQINIVRDRPVGTNRIIFSPHYTNPLLADCTTPGWGWDPP